MRVREFYAQQVVEANLLHEIMVHAGFKAALMRAPRLADTGGTHGLPPGCRVLVLPIAALPAAPKDWVREAGTYVCPVDTDWGLWFDWTMNDPVNTAVVASVKGMNPITGQKLEALRQEQYADKCPVHGEPFAHDRMCEKCGYQWPPQNYVSHPNTLWWDGFRQPDGTVRQFFFSADDKRDIASLVMGKENTVMAFGFAFWSPKNPRLVQQHLTRSCFGQSLGFDGVPGAVGGMGVTGPTGPLGDDGVMGFCGSDSDVNDDLNIGSVTYTAGLGGQQVNYNATSGTSGATKGGGASAMSCYQADSLHTKGVSTSLHAKAPMSAKSARSKMATRSVSVGAGARIHQDLAQDSLGLDGWKPETAAVIRLYFCFEEQFREIVKAGGVKDLKGHKEGYLKGLPVG